MAKKGINSRIKAAIAAPVSTGRPAVSGSNRPSALLDTPRCVQLARVLKKTGSFYYHCDWHASHYLKMMLEDLSS